MRIGKAMLIPILGLGLFLSGCQGYCSLLPNTCGLINTGTVRHSKVISIKWSPDGTRLAFTYQNGESPYNSRYSLYLVNADGTQLKKLLETDVKNSTYILYQWAEDNQILAGDPWNLYDVDSQGVEKKIFSLSKERVNGYNSQIQNACHLTDTRYVVIQSSLPFLESMSLLQTETSIVVPAKINPPYPFLPPDPHWSTSATLKCLLNENNLYIGQVNSSAEQKKFEAYHTISKVKPDSAEIGNVTVFKSIVPPTDRFKEAPVFRFLGNDIKTNLVYSLNPLQGRPSIQSYNIESKETSERHDIKVFGEFSPDFQKVAFLEEDTDYQDDNIVISNPDGSQKKIVAKVKDIPKGTMP